MRLCIPLGLNMCSPFHSITKSERPPSILAPARSIVEEETRRNAFWLAYTIEREHGYGNGWAMALDDQDISQLLPICGNEFQNSVCAHLPESASAAVPDFLPQTMVQPSDRQWAHAKDVLYCHPEQTTDSFVLYIKGTILLCEFSST